MTISTRRIRHEPDIKVSFFAVYYLTSSGCFKTVAWKILTLVCVLISVRLWMVGPNKQDFWPKINILKENHCILRIRGAPVHQKCRNFLFLKSTDFFKKKSFKNINLGDHLL